MIRSLNFLSRFLIASMLILLTSLSSTLYARDNNYPEKNYNSNKVFFASVKKNNRFEKKKDKWKLVGKYPEAVYDTNYIKRPYHNPNLIQEQIAYKKQQALKKEQERQKAIEQEKQKQLAQQANLRKVALARKNNAINGYIAGTANNTPNPIYINNVNYINYLRYNNNYNPYITGNIPSYNVNNTINSDTLSTIIEACPLMLDIDHDGVINAKARSGIDINGDGKPDGTSISGDKILAMSDLNNNNIIDGSEIFGNFSIDPVTKEPIKANNGFDALKIIAYSLQSKTNIKCITNNNLINLYNFQEALQKATNNKVTLGYVSDNNLQNLEKLEMYDVKAININYVEKPFNRKNSVQSRLTSFYLTSSGLKYKIEDIWFITK